MKNIVIYYSQTGNTLEIATRIANDTKASLYEVSNISVSDALEYDNIILGCPALGDEELDPDFEDFYKEVVSKVTNQHIYIFGSYAWNTGEFIVKWNEDVKSHLGDYVPSLAVFETEIEEDKYQDFISSISI